MTKCQLLALVTVPLCSLASGCMVGDSNIGGNDENIIGGETDYGDPSVVALLAFKADGNVSLCTATVIAPTKLLTAAHCVDPRLNGEGTRFEMRAGTDITKPTETHGVARTAFDPGFDPNNLGAGHDIAVVTLDSPTGLAPIPFSRGSDVGGGIRIVGYGMNSHVSHPLVPSGAGTKRFVNTDVTGADAALIAIGSTGAQTCHGDSGGPAFQVVGGAEVIVGVTSYGHDLPGNVVCVEGGVDTRVDAYGGFIDANM